MIRMKSGFLKSLFGFSLASWVGAIITFVLVPIVTRVFEPSDIGRINYYNAMVEMMLPFFCLGLDQGYVRFYSETADTQPNRELFSFALMGSLLAIAIALPVSFVWKKEIALAFVGSNDNLIMWNLLASLIAAVVLRYALITYRLEKNSFGFTRVKVASVMVTRVLYLIVALNNPNYRLAISFISIGSLLVAVATAVAKRRYIGRVNIRKNKELYKRVALFGFPMMPVILLSSFNNNLPVIMLRKFVSPSDLGIYTTAITIVGIITLFQSGFNLIWHPYVYANYQDKQQNLELMHQAITGTMISIAAGLIFLQPAILLILGEKFRDVQQFLPFLLIGPICATIGETTGIGINIKKKSYLNIIVYIASVFTGILLGYMLVPRFALIGAAVTSASASIVMLAIKTLVGEKQMRIVTDYRYMVVGIVALICMGTWNLVFYGHIVTRTVGLLVLIGIFILVNKNVIELVYKTALSSIKIGKFSTFESR